MRCLRVETYGTLDELNATLSLFHPGCGSVIAPPPSKAMKYAGEKVRILLE
ncbi:hypothetical protein [Escherichia coli]|uniref:hypothetical protein n=1 Tax=Escherichia coli TaxID=562 RepID=UPI003986E712